MAVKRESKFSYQFMFSLLILALGTVLLYDVKLHGSWQASRTYIALKDKGVIDYYYKATERGRQGLIWTHEQLDKQFPGYYEKVYNVLQPYGELCRDMGLVMYNVMLNIKDIAADKYPVVVESIEFYAPGVIEQSQKTVQNAWTTSALYFNKSIVFLQKEVFVGKLAPENVQKVVIEALNTTQQKASEYYHWVYEKVQSSIK